MYIMRFFLQRALNNSIYDMDFIKLVSAKIEWEFLYGEREQNRQN